MRDDPKSVILDLLSGYWDAANTYEVTHELLTYNFLFRISQPTVKTLKL